MTPTGRARSARPTLCAAVATLTLLLSGSAGHAAPSRATSLTLRGVTTLNWSGNAGVRLVVPKAVTLTPTSLRLYVTGGSYAAVRWTTTRPCPSSLPCPVLGITYLRELIGTYFTEIPDRRTPGFDHHSELRGPERLDAGVHQMYLMTDGRARLEMRVEGLAGATSAVPGGRIRAGVIRLPTTCAETTLCTPTGGYTGRVSAGGTDIDLGRAGFVQTFAFSIDRPTRLPDGTAPAQPHPVRACIYLPDGNPPPGGVDPRPLGCNHPSADRERLLYEADNTTAELTLGVHGRVGAMVWVTELRATGRVYTGFRVGSPQLAPTVLGGVAVWLRYGIS